MTWPTWAEVEAEALAELAARAAENGSAVELADLAGLAVEAAQAVWWAHLGRFDEMAWMGAPPVRERAAAPANHNDATAAA